MATLVMVNFCSARIRRMQEEYSEKDMAILEKHSVSMPQGRFGVASCSFPPKVTL